MLITDFLNQTETHQKRSRTNERGESLYLPPKQIACRRVTENIYESSAQKQAIGVQTVYYINIVVDVGDNLGGKVVKTVKPFVDLEGKEQGYKVTVDG